MEGCSTENLRALEMNTLPLMTLRLAFCPLRYLNSKLSGIRGRYWTCYFCHRVDLMKKKSLTSASYSTGSSPWG